MADAPGPDGDDATSTAATDGRTRLAPGELRRMVLEHLHTHPGVELTPHQIGRALGGRSAGAIANALATLAARGEVVETSEKPRKYALTSE